MRKPVRVCLSSTPRSGNTWMRHALADWFEAPSSAVHSPREVDWSALPDRYVLQIHWPPSESWLRRLRQHNFRVVSIARHPAAVLLSILRFAQRDDSTSRWLLGRAGNERALVGATPIDQQFAQYVKSPRAKLLLGITPSWWLIPATVKLRFEDLIANPSVEMGKVLAELDADAGKRTQDGIMPPDLLEMRRRVPSNAYHFWTGSASGWRRFMTRELSEAIQAHHNEAFAVLGYSPLPVDNSAEEVQMEWLVEEATILGSINNDLKWELTRLAAENDQLRADLASAEVDYGVGPRVLRVARAITRARRFFGPHATGDNPSRKS